MNRSTRTRWLAVFVVFPGVLAADTGCNESSKSSRATNGNSAPEIHLVVDPAEEAGVTRDGRIVLRLSDKGFMVKGASVQIGRTTKAELEKLLGPLDRVEEPVGHPIGLWDNKGLRIYYSKKTGKVDFFDCIFVPDADSIVAPEHPFDGVFKVEGIEISKATTKEALDARIMGKISDNPPRFPGFSVEYPTHEISFELTKDRKSLQMVRIDAELQLLHSRPIRAKAKSKEK